MLSIDASGTLVLPGTGPSSRTEAMTLRVRNLRVDGGPAEAGTPTWPLRRVR